MNCIKSQVDITEELQKQEVIFFDKYCERYLQPPKYWVKCDLESRELLTLCLKKIRGLSKVKLIDANFVWTEPHSKRLKVKVTIQKDVLQGTKLQSSFIIEYIIKNQMCETCHKSFTPHKWVASVQLR
jgi:nonsense-mediated mRNA decay protein 3